MNYLSLGYKVRQMLLRPGLKVLLIALFCVLCVNHPALAQNYCLSFDGSNDYVAVNPVPAFNGTTTIEAWIKVVIPTGYAIAEPNIVSWGNDANSVEFRLGISGANATLQFGIDATGSGGGAWQAIYGSTNINTGIWVHVAVVKNGNTSTLYINGASETSGTISRSPALNTFDIGNLNEHGSQQNRYFPGFIDEVRIWNTARSQAEIQANMYRELAGTESGLTNYYKMTDGSNSTLTDNKGSSTGIISGATWNQPDAFPVDVFVSGNYAAGYGNIKSAFDAINAGTHTGAITLQLNGSTVENAAAVLNASGTGSSSYTSVNIYPAVSGVTISGNLATPLIDLNGADNVTIDGRVNATNSTKDLVVTNTSNSGNGGTSTIRMYNGANNNTVKYCTIKGSSTDGSGGVIFLGATAASTGNTVDNNNITNAADANRPINAIYSGGAANTVTISNNNIYDFLSRISSSNGINLNTSTAASTISGNSLYETSTFNPTANRAYYYPIYINSSAAGFVVSGNYIGGNAPLCSGTWIKSNTAYSNFCAINVVSVGTGTPSVLKGNTVNGITWSNNNNDTATMCGIVISSGDVTLGVAGEPNTIGSVTGTPNLTFNYDTGGSLIPIVLNGSGYITCQYNNIGGITCNNSNSVQFTRFYCIARWNNNTAGIISNNTIGSATNPISCTSPSTGDWQWIVGIENIGGASTGLTISNNSISYLNNSATNLGYVSGIHSYDQPIVLTASGNSIHDLTIANSGNGSGRDASVRGGIWVSSCNKFSINNNAVYNLTNTYASFNGYMYGIYCTGGSDVNDCSGNTVYNLSATGTGAGPFMYGIYFSGYSEVLHTVNTIKQNYVFGFSSAGVNTYCSNTRYYGIYKQYSTDAVIANNILNFGGNNMSAIYGIYEEGNNVARSTSVYYNTVYIGGAPTAGNLDSYALFSANNNIRTFKNNILCNARSNNGGVGHHYCIYYGTTPPATSDYNDLYAPGSSGYLGRYIDTYCTTLSAWRTATNGEANSLNTNPSFASAGGTSATDYLPSATSLVATTGTGITTDYDGGAERSSTYPSMGAFEYNVAPPCANPTNGGTIGTAQAICSGFAPAAFTSSAAASGNTGKLEYKWQVSTTSASAGFSDIASSNSAIYAPGTLFVNSWYKRLARVDCMTDWTGAAESNAVKVTINQPSFTPAAYTVANLQATGQNIKWYSASTGGSQLAASTAIVNGTHYFASQTVNGVESTARLEVTATVDPTPCAPTGAPTQSYSTGATVASLQSTGSSIRWYSASSGGTALASSVVLVDGTHYFASQTINCTESATRLEVIVTIN